MPEAKDMALTEKCILQFRRNDNIIQWQENIDSYIATWYGLTGKFMSTNVRYVIPAPREADYLDFPEREEGEDPLPNLPTTGNREHSSPASEILFYEATWKGADLGNQNKILSSDKSQYGIWSASNHGG